MSLSIRGVHEISRLLKSKNTKLIILADPLAKDSDLTKVILEQKWPMEYSKKLSSDTLINMNMLIHFPSMIIMKNGVFSDHVYPGYSSEKELSGYFEKQGVKF